MRKFIFVLKFRKRKGRNSATYVNYAPSSYFLLSNLPFLFGFIWFVNGWGICNSNRHDASWYFKTRACLLFTMPCDVYVTELWFSLSLSLFLFLTFILVFMQIHCGECDHGPLAKGCTTVERCHGLERFCMSCREVTSGTA